jgi:hypothetical protein
MANRQFLRRARRTPRNFARMLLPHERDETADRQKPGDAPREDMKRAERDIAAGREDTDCRSQPPLKSGGACDPNAVLKPERKE